MFNNTKTFPDFFQSNHYENIHTLVIKVLQNSNCENKDSQHGEKMSFVLHSPTQVCHRRHGHTHKCGYNQVDKVAPPRLKIMWQLLNQMWSIHTGYAWILQPD